MADRQSDNDDWMKSMYDIQAETLSRALGERNRLALRVRDLERQLASGVASELSAMQDRITMLEQQLAATPGVRATSSASAESVTARSASAVPTTNGDPE